jgi:flagellar biosynthesis protein FlhG
MLQAFGNSLMPKNQAQANGKKYEVIAVTSGKGGVGKSTVSVNMAINLQQMNRKVLLMDADIHLGNIDLLLGTRSRLTLADVLKDGVELGDVVIQGPGNIDILPASSASLDIIESEDIFLRKLSAAFNRFEHNYDYIIMDTGAGIARNVISFLLSAQKIVLVITPDPASITDAYAVIKVVRSVNKDIPIFLTANMVNSADEGEILFKKMNLMVQKFLESKIQFGGSILRDDLIIRSVKQQKPFVLHHPNSGSTTAIRVLNRRVLHTSGLEGQHANLFERMLQNKKIQFEWDQ